MQRGTATQRGYDARYRRDRKRMLRDADRCALCGLPPTKDDPLTADHVVPVSKGGKRGPLRPAHRSCNSRRGNRG